MITIAICDDDPAFANRLWKAVYNLCATVLPDDVDSTVLPVFVRAKSVLEYLEHNKINIIFLDIDMPNISGFQLAEQLCSKYPDMLIIFVSLYEDFVYTSFEYSPFRFIRKSRVKEELAPAFRKAVEKCLFTGNALSFETVDGEQILLLKDVTYIEGDKNYYVVHLLSGASYKCRGTLTTVEQRLSSYHFFRIQTSFIVNLDQISEIQNKNAVLKDGTEIPVSRRKNEAFEKAYMQIVRRRFENT